METIHFKQLPLKADMRVLDIGAGEGRHSISAHYYQSLNMVAVDLCLNDLNTARQRFHDCFAEGIPGSFSLIQSNAEKLPFVDHSFDIIICSEVLEHIENFENVLAEIHRLLKPGGQFAVSVPRYGPEKICWWLSEAYHQVAGGHIRIFKAKTLQKTIEKVGFDYYHKHYEHGLHSPYWWLKCLFWKHQDSNPLVRWYHKLLVWDLLKKPLLTRFLERILNPLIGKSIVMYFNKQ